MIKFNCQHALVPEEEAREIIGKRFLADPNFKVFLNGTQITFEDISDKSLDKISVEIPGYGAVELITIDSQKTDRTTKQHGIAWRVKSRLVGNIGWIDFNHKKILDGRSSEAKRFLFIILADLLEDCIKADWTNFDSNSKVWALTKQKVYEAINTKLSEYTIEKRSETKTAVKSAHLQIVNKLQPASRERWTQFVDTVVDTCPSITQSEVEQIAGILAKLERANSKYGLITKLSELETDDFDNLESILGDWTVRLAKDALDEIQTRLKLIQELNSKLSDTELDEVRDIQPLIDRSLWIFGPEYESIEFTSNKSINTVINALLDKGKMTSKINKSQSTERPDYVILPDGNANFYTRDSYDENSEVNGIGKLIVVEIKKPGVPIGSDQLEQPWRYVKRIIETGLINTHTPVSCFVLGSSIEELENKPNKKGDNVIIYPLTYGTFIKRAQARMFGLQKKLINAPFLQEYIEEIKPE